MIIIMEIEADCNRIGKIIPFIWLICCFFLIILSIRAGYRPALHNRVIFQFDTCQAAAIDTARIDGYPAGSCDRHILPDQSIGRRMAKNDRKRPPFPAVEKDSRIQSMSEALCFARETGAD
jgi:hypothetical protein